ncbi:aldolase catalytic domain-containing protein [Psychromonas sp. MME2]|uniref:aldolase catalytic domain-containing protein n=1 Tax=unclassified Psychromonas TaxID=2614957 RepID=UPI00339BAA4A
MIDFKILDCTLRDGGYYNDWDFNGEVLTNYLNAIAESGIEYVELGLRNFPKGGFLGAFAYTTDRYINTIDLPDGPTYGVMVDAKTILNSDMSVELAIDSLFADAADSKVSLVRVAAHFGEVEASGPIVKRLKEKGYIVGYNLMQAGGKPTEVIAEKARIAASWNVLDVLYFADSLGNMDADEVRRIVKTLRTEWHGELGIHTHNNMAKALDNCLAAKHAGVTWLDVTITGMGRGAGNAQTENLLAVVSQETGRYQPKSIYELAIRDFEPMQKKYGWGSNLLYFIGAQHNVHPTYVQNLLSDTHYGPDEIVGVVKYLSYLNNSESYSDETYAASLMFSAASSEISGSNALAGSAKGKNVVILASGPSLFRYKKDIETYLSALSEDSLVIAINTLIDFEQYIDYYCLSGNSKMLSQSGDYSSLGKPIILPAHRFSTEELAGIKANGQIFDYGVEVKSDTFLAGESNCILPYDITAGYLFALCESMQATQVKLIGFDGYSSGDSRQSEMIEIFSKVNSAHYTALTPTTYPISQGSIYGEI